MSNAQASRGITVDVTSSTLNANSAASVTVGGVLTNTVASQTLNVVQASVNKAFAPTVIDSGGTSTLTFTITNGAGNPSQSGIGFTDNLPGNVLVAATPNVQSNCPADRDITRLPSSHTATSYAISILDKSAAMTNAVASCQVRVDVTSSVVGGPYTNTSANIASPARITNSVTASSLTVQSLPSLDKAFAPSTIGVGQTSTLTFTVINPALSAART